MRHTRQHPIAVLVMLVAAAALIAAGVAQGDALDTLRKAALICFECIGIG